MTSIWFFLSTHHVFCSQERTSDQPSDYNIIKVISFMSSLAALLEAQALLSLGSFFLMLALAVQRMVFFCCEALMFRKGFAIAQPVSRPSLGPT